MNVAVKYQGVVAADFLVAKALKISEISQMAKSEVRLREFLIKTWAEFSKEAVDRAVKLIEKNASAKKIIEEIDGVMWFWADEVTPVVSNEIDFIFRTAKTLGYKKATRQTEENLNYGLPKTKTVKKAKTVAEILPDFTLADERAIEALKAHQVYWIGEHYEKNVSKIIAKRVKRTVLERGISPLKAGKLLRSEVRGTLGSFSIPGGFRGTNQQYFEGLAANAATNARVAGQLHSFASIGIKSYKISAVSDKRTCQRCEHMSGKVFKTSQGVEQQSWVLSSKTPDDVKLNHPWLSYKDIKNISPNPGPQTGKAGIKDAENLQANGLALPPFHFKCRCTVDISDEIQSYDQLSPIEPTVPKVPKLPVKKPPKVKKPKAATPKKPKIKLSPLQREMNPWKDKGLAPLDKVSLETQVIYRMNEEKVSIEEALAKALEDKKELAIKFGKEIPTKLSNHRTGEVIRETIIKELKITKGRKYIEHTNDEVELLMIRGAKRNYNRKAWKLNVKKSKETHEMGMEFVDDRLYEKAKNKMPRVYETKTSTGKMKGGFQNSIVDEDGKELSGIVIDNFKDAVEGKYFTQVVKHEYGHFLDTLGQNGQASVITRNLFAEEGKLLQGPWDIRSKYIKGKWVEKYTGRIYGPSFAERNKNLNNYMVGASVEGGKGGMAGGSEISSEWFSTLTELLETGSVDKNDLLTTLGREWENNPLRVSFMKSYLKGHFVE